MKNDYREISITGKGEINRLERFVEEICDYYNINNEYFGNILLATTEAADILITLDDHTPETRLCISFDRNSKGLVFKIKLFEGQEVLPDSEDLLDREIRKHRLAKDIFIIKALADEITISVNAKQIVLVFYVSSMNYEKSLYRINKLKDYWSKQETFIHKKNE
jgi:hypothetical protein